MNYRCAVSRFLLLFDPDKLLSVVASALRLAEYAVLGIKFELRGAGENPQVLVAATAYEGVAVVGGEHKDAIVGVEGTAKRNAEQGWRSGLLGASLRNLPFVLADASVDHLDGAILLQCVERGAVGHVSLKAVVQTGNLVPLALELLQINSRYDRVVHCEGRTASTENVEESGSNNADANDVGNAPLELTL